MKYIALLFITVIISQNLVAMEKPEKEKPLIMLAIENQLNRKIELIDKKNYTEIPIDEQISISESTSFLFKFEKAPYFPADLDIEFLLEHPITKKKAVNAALTFTTPDYILDDAIMRLIHYDALAEPENAVFIKVIFNYNSKHRIDGDMTIEKGSKPCVGIKAASLIPLNLYR